MDLPPHPRPSFIHIYFPDLLFQQEINKNRFPLKSDLPEDVPPPELLSKYLVWWVQTLNTQFSQERKTTVSIIKRTNKHANKKGQAPIAQ